MWTQTASPGPCPCGGGESYVACCRVLHAGRPAETAEALMRARYSAYAVGHHDYVFRTWHPRTRPPDVAGWAGTEWTGLRVLRVESGGADDDHGVVEFEAAYRTAAGADLLHETSRFERRRGQWVYVDALP